MNTRSIDAGRKQALRGREMDNNPIHALLGGPHCRLESGSSLSARDLTFEYFWQIWLIKELSPARSYTTEISPISTGSRDCLYFTGCKQHTGFCMNSVDSFESGKLKIPQRNVVPTTLVTRVAPASERRGSQSFRQRPSICGVLTSAHSPTRPLTQDCPGIRADFSRGQLQFPEEKVLRLWLCTPLIFYEHFVMLFAS